MALRNSAKVNHLSSLKKLFNTRIDKLTRNGVPVAQWQSIVLAAQRLWVRFPRNHTDKKMYSLNAL